MISSEAAPFAKTGGLADVVGALPTALHGFGDEVAVVLPRYGSIDLKHSRRVWENLFVHLGPAAFPITIYQAPAEYPVYLVDCPLLFERKGFYGDSAMDFPDNHIRFAVFARAALAVARVLFRTEILHCHDWQSGLVPAYLRTTFASDPTYLGCRTLFTIHNLGYQGLFPKSALADVALPAEDVFHPNGMEFFGRVSYIKAGIALADALSTVSPTYAREIQTPEYGFGLDGALRARSNVLTGILNGVDYREWNPETDPLIPARYSEGDMSGKEICKRHLIGEFGLPPEAMGRPLLGIVSRFTRIQRDYPGRIGVRIGFDNGLAHRIEAGADIFVMPSHYEPCGLNQIYSLRYGTVPVVRATGGLDDTIDEGTGFKFAEYSGEALLEAVRAAAAAFTDLDAWRNMMRNGMRKDFSWKTSAAAYSELYRRLLGR